MSNSTNGDLIRSNLSNEYEKTPGYLLWDVSEATGLVLDDMDSAILDVAKLFNIDNLSGDELTTWVLQRKGLVRKVATYAVTTLTVTGTGTVAAGDLFETDNDVQFAADAEVAINSSGSVAVTAVVAGNTGMVGADTITDIPVTIEGITACTNAAATTGGYDEETDGALRARYYTALQTPASSNNKAAYKNWALSVSGVGAVEVFGCEDSVEGDNSVDVVIINSSMLPADSALVADVQEYIDPNSTGTGEGAAPIGAYCYVTSATALTINVAVKLTLIATAVQATVEAAIRAALTTYLAGIVFTKSSDVNAPVSYAKIGEEIIETDGVQDYENLTVNSGTANIPVADRYVAVLGEVTFTYA